VQPTIRTSDRFRKCGRSGLEEEFGEPALEVRAAGKIQLGRVDRQPSRRIAWAVSVKLGPGFCPHFSDGFTPPRSMGGGVRRVGAYSPVAAQATIAFTSLMAAERW
jgi:hypothetical protein